jgi:DUF1365 family protein
MTSGSAIYRGLVVHERHRPRKHRLQYRVFSMLLDLDELPGLDRRLRGFGYNRTRIFSFYDKDHGSRDGRPLRSWVEEKLAAKGIDLAGGRVLVLCYPRLFGYVFNPLTVYYCHLSDGRLTALIYEVSNTFDERHCYVVPVTAEGTALPEHGCDKAFYVSPFLPMDCRYSFRGCTPHARASVIINQSDREGLLLTASFTGRRAPLSDANLLRCFLAYPLMTFKVIAGIHWEALRLWRKRIPVYRHVPAVLDPDGPKTIQENS